MITGNEPINVTYFEDGEVNSEGLSKREYFAAMAMVNFQGNTYSGYPYEEIANMSVNLADALINALNK